MVSNVGVLCAGNTDVTVLLGPLVSVQSYCSLFILYLNFCRLYFVFKMSTLIVPSPLPAFDYFSFHFQGCLTPYSAKDLVK